jgi:hypothetical protein
MKKNIYLIGISFIIHCSSNALIAQETNNTLADYIKFSGYVKNDFLYDTRQTVSAREGHFLLFPSDRLYDSLGNDINAVPNYNILAIQSKLSIKITGPEAFGAKTSGLIEGDFFGQADVNINLFRLRHAYLKLQWAKTSLLFGQYWHPFFVTDCYPGVLSFNTGAPFQPFSRAPQIRINVDVAGLNLQGTILSQRDYRSVGPDGSDSKYLRNSGVPEVHAQVSYAVKNETGVPVFIAGSSVGYKRLVPRIQTYLNYATDSYVQGLSANLFLTYKSEKLILKAQGNYIENGSDLMLSSGYAVADTINRDEGLLSYAPLRTATFWTELILNSDKIQPGIFIGYSKNLGSKEIINGPVYILSNATIDHLFRLAPRINFISGKTTIGIEVEYTAAAYGTADEHVKMIDTHIVSNTRFLLAAIYNF